LPPMCCSHCRLHPAPVHPLRTPWQCFKPQYRPNRRVATLNYANVVKAHCGRKALLRKLDASSKASVPTAKFQLEPTQLTDANANRKPRNRKHPPQHNRKDAATDKGAHKQHNAHASTQKPPHTWSPRPSSPLCSLYLYSHTTRPMPPGIFYFLCGLVALGPL
jgi:hypothetical protein